MARPNPSKVLDELINFIDHLVQECSWSSSKIHLFGFAQGGSIAAELALRYWRASDYTASFGSLVSICGPLISYPTMKACPTHLLIVARPGSEQSALSSSERSALLKGFNGKIVEKNLAKIREGMPASRDEWETPMAFWAEVLTRRLVGTGLYEIESLSNS